MITTAIFIFILGLLLALVEIEIEGRNGWAEKLPTWYKTKGFVTRVFSFFNSGKPMTGYHLFLQLFVLLLFHFHFFLGVEWSLGGELVALSLHSLFLFIWDYLWFILNPHYGVRNFRKTNVWWFSKSSWFLGFIPSDYLKAVFGSFLFAYGASLLGVYSLFSFLTVFATVVVLMMGAVIFSPVYRRIYINLRSRDQRSLMEIFHKVEHKELLEDLRELKEEALPVSNK